MTPDVDFEGDLGGVRDVVELARILLLTCRRHPEALRRAQAQQTLDLHERRLRGAVADVLRNAGRPSALLSLSQRERLLKLLREGAASPGSAVFAARAAASGVDAVLAEGPLRVEVNDLFESRQRFELREDDIFPIATPNLVKLLGTKLLGTHPNNTSLPADGMRHLGLMPPVPGAFSVWMSFETAPALGAFVNDRRVGIGLPNNSLSAEFDFDTVPPPPATPTRFFHVRPKSEPTQIVTLERLLAIAESERLPLFLLPELCSTPTAHARVLQWFSNPRLGTGLLLAGSYHLEERGQRTNTSIALAPKAPGIAQLRHDKFNPFEYPWEGHLLREHLDMSRPARITLHWSRELSFLTLICKDFLVPELRTLLVHLRPSLLMMASLSPKTDLFSTRALDLADSAQTMTFIANFRGERGGKGSPAAALAALPLRGSRRFIARTWKGLDAPLVATLRLDERRPHWELHPCRTT